SLEISVRASLSDTERSVYEFLSLTPLNVDALLQLTGLPIWQISAALTMLEIGGLALRKPGDYYTLASAEPASSGAAGIHHRQNEGVIRRAVEFIKQRFHAISRKYLQNYLALCWYHQTGPDWSARQLLGAAVGAAYISDAEITAYVSPA